MGFKQLLTQTIRPLQWLSLDVALGACAGMFFFAHVVDIELELTFYLLMAMAVWSIYTLDHLLDARQVEGTASTSRHRFHQVYFKQLGIALAVVVMAGFALAFYLLDVSLLAVSALILGLVIVGNMYALKYWFKGLAFLKEVNIALFYTIGLMLVPYLLSSGEVHKGFWLLGLAYFLVSLMNLWLLSLMDDLSDKQDGFTSLVTLWGKERVQVLLLWLMGGGLVFILSLFWILRSYLFIHISLVLILFLIHSLEVLNPTPDSQVARRKLEAAFMLPFILLFF